MEILKLSGQGFSNIICAVSEDVPTVPAAERLRVDETEYIRDGLMRVSARYGFKEDRDIGRARRRPVPGIELAKRP